MAITPGQKQAIEEVLAALTSATGSPRKRQLAGMFLELVDREDWPEYYEVIPEPRCLNNIQTMLEKNRYKDPLDAYTDLSLVFWNALFYNEPDSQIAMDAQTLKDLLQSEWKSRPLPTPRDSPPPSSAQKVHEPAPKQAPQPTPKRAPVSRQTMPPPTMPTTPAAIPPQAAPTPSTSTLHDKPMSILPAPVPIFLGEPPRPPSPDSDSDSDFGDEDDAYDQPPGAPTDVQVVRRLERGLPRYAPVQGVDGGWMADLVQHEGRERHLEIVQAIKAYRDPAGVKLSTALDPGVPEDKTAITFRLLESRSRSKTFYPTSAPFDADVARLFEAGRRYWLERAGGVWGGGGEEWARVLALQRIAHTFTSSHPPPLPLSLPLVLPTPLREAGSVPLESIAHKGWALKVGDWVHVYIGVDPSASESDQAQLGAGQGKAGKLPVVGRIVGCWRNADEADDGGQIEGEGGVSVQWYLRAEEIAHMMPPTARIEGEVVQTDKTTHHLLPDVLERVGVQHLSSAERGRPKAPAWFPGWPLYVCGYRLDAARNRIRRIRRAEWFSEGLSSETAEALHLFERPIRLGAGGQGRAKKQSVVVDRSVVSAAGVAVSAVEKLGPETTRHFERDPTTGELLWFAGPPMHVARVPPPRHRLEYLYFRARKYNPQIENEGPKVKSEDGVVNGTETGNGAANSDAEGMDDAMGSDTPDAPRPSHPHPDSDVEMDVQPPAKRQKLASASALEEKQGRYMSASERIREVLARSVPGGSAVAEIVAL
ncbi:RSC complex protein [Mycena galericulata]|nr:RSC complex protein [Mycena galericulata]